MCSLCVSESVGLWVDVQLGIYVSKGESVRPLCGELCLLWIVACLLHTVSVTCFSCGMQPNHLETLTLPKPQDLLELGMLDGMTAKC